MTLKITMGGGGDAQTYFVHAKCKNPANPLLVPTSAWEAFFYVLRIWASQEKCGENRSFPVLTVGQVSEAGYTFNSDVGGCVPPRTGQH